MAVISESDSAAAMNASVYLGFGCSIDKLEGKWTSVGLTDTLFFLVKLADYWPGKKLRECRSIPSDLVGSVVKLDRKHQFGNANQ
jgi:hypothetical protein